MEAVVLLATASVARGERESDQPRHSNSLQHATCCRNDVRLIALVSVFSLHPVPSFYLLHHEAFQKKRVLHV